jgi:hypothetical protein
VKTVARMLITVTAGALLFAVPSWSQSQREVTAQAVVPQDSSSNVPPKGTSARKIEELRMERIPGEPIPFPPIKGWRQEVSTTTADRRRRCGGSTPISNAVI